MHELYNRLKKLRHINKKSQDDIAEYLGISRRTYNSLENGHTKINLHHICKLADLYNTSVDYLLGRTDVEKPYERREDYDGF